MPGAEERAIEFHKYAFNFQNFFNMLNRILLNYETERQSQAKNLRVVFIPVVKFS